MFLSHLDNYRVEKTGQCLSVKSGALDREINHRNSKIMVYIGYLLINKCVCLMELLVYITYVVHITLFLFLL